MQSIEFDYKDRLANAKYRVEAGYEYNGGDILVMLDRVTLDFEDSWIEVYPGNDFKEKLISYAEELIFERRECFDHEASWK